MHSSLPERKVDYFSALEPIRTSLKRAKSIYRLYPDTEIMKLIEDLQRAEEAVLAQERIYNQQDFEAWQRELRKYPIESHIAEIEAYERELQDTSA